MEYYSAIKKNEIQSHEKTWEKLKCILLTERSQSEKSACCIFPILWHSGKGKNYRILRRLAVAKGYGGMKDE